MIGDQGASGESHTTSAAVAEPETEYWEPDYVRSSTEARDFQR
jgi:hypothetical protein